MLTGEKEHSIIVTEQQKKYCISLPYDGVNSYTFDDVVEIYKLKAKIFEINVAALCLGNVSKDFSVNNLKKTELHRYVYGFLVDYDSIGVDDILDIHRYLMKKSYLK